jgi:hypothetical protein
MSPQLTQQPVGHRLTFGAEHHQVPGVELLLEPGYLGQHPVSLRRQNAVTTLLSHIPMVPDQENQRGDPRVRALDDAGRHERTGHFGHYLLDLRNVAPGIMSQVMTVNYL